MLSVSPCLRAYEFIIIVIIIRVCSSQSRCFKVNRSSSSSSKSSGGGMSISECEYVD